MSEQSPTPQADDSTKKSIVTPTSKSKALPGSTFSARAARWLGLGTILVALTGFAAWASLAPLHGAVVAMGLVKSEGHRKAVQHTEGGIIKKLYVKDGDTVKAGGPLLELEAVDVDASFALVSELILFETLRQARLDAEQQLIEVFDLPAELDGAQPGVDEAFQREHRIFSVRRANLDDQLASYQREIAAIDTERAAIERMIVADRRSVALAQEQLQLNKSLGAQKAIAHLDIIQVERIYTDYQAQLSEHEADLSRAIQKQDEIRLKMALSKNEYQNRAAEEFKESASKRVELRERLRPLEAGTRRKVLTAPADGQVVGLRYHAAGEVVSPREVILEIVPEGDLVVDAKVNLDAINDLYLGQEADVRFTTFNSRTTPMVKGAVTYISADALEQPNGTPYYQVLVRPDADSVARAGIQNLQPGMAAEVFCLTQSRSALDYLLAPIMDVVRHAMRER